MQTHTCSADLVYADQMEAALRPPRPPRLRRARPPHRHRRVRRTRLLTLLSELPCRRHLNTQRSCLQPHQGFTSECLSARLAPPGFLLDAHIVTTVLSFDLRRVFDDPDRTRIVRVDHATCVLHAKSVLTCFSLFMGAYRTSLSLSCGGPFCVWRA